VRPNYSSPQTSIQQLHPIGLTASSSDKLTANKPQKRYWKDEEDNKLRELVR